MDDPNADEDLIPPDERRPQRLLDSRRQADGEMSDSDDEGEDDRRDSRSHRDPDSAGPAGGGRRFGTAVGIMSTGSTHGIGPTVALPVPTAVATTTPAESDMDIDDDEEAPLSQTVRGKAKASSTTNDSMPVDPPQTQTGTDVSTS